MSVEPRDYATLYRLALRFGQAGKFADAERMMGEAIALDPASADAYFARGYALQRLGRSAEAVACFDAVLRFRPGFAEALLNRAAALFGLRRYDDAAADYDALLARDPDYPFARGNRLFSRLHCCDWTELETETAAIARDLRRGRPAIAPFDAKALALSPEDELRAARIWVARQCPPDAQPMWRGEIYSHPRIRIAYLAHDLANHPAAPLLAGVIAAQDHECFETIAISFGPEHASPLLARLERDFTRYIASDNESDFEIAARLKEMDVDIAVDLMGFTQTCRPGIFARRPCPLQVNYLGYPGTMGADYIDYIIADGVVVPPEETANYAEAVVTLSGTFFPGDCTGAPLASPTRENAGLPPDAFIFCAFNNVYKITPAIFAVWMRLLAGVKASVLWLTQTNAAAVRNLRQAAEAHGIAPERLIFAPFTATRQDHLARLALADLFLDTRPYNAHATANDALAAGVPVLTAPGRTFASRVAASQAAAIGLSDLIVASLEDYEAAALRLARDPSALAALRARLARNRGTHPLFDTARFARHLEAAFTEMAARARRGEPVRSFAVAPLS